MTVDAVTLSAGVWLTLAFHPTGAPATIAVSPSSGLELCKVAIDTLAIEGCAPGSADGVNTFTTQNAHLAYAIRHSGAGADVTTSVRLSYTSADTWLLLQPPSGATSIKATFTPRSTRVGAEAFVVPEYSRPTDAQINFGGSGFVSAGLSQCDFLGTESDCRATVTPGHVVTVTMTMTPPQPRVALQLAWL